MNWCKDKAAWLVFVIAMLLAVLFSTASLQKGQVAKQFFAFSISESLSYRFDVLGTVLPCLPPRVWVEEPPVFHVLAVGLAQVGLPLTVTVSLLAYFLIGLAAIVWSTEKTFSLASGSWIAVTFCLFAPAFTKYSIQHLPDLLATAFLGIGVIFLLRKKTGAALLFFTLSVTTKGLTVFAVAPLMLFEFYQQRDQQTKITKTNLLFSWGRLGAQMAIVLLPSLVWLVLLQVRQVPSPFHFNNGIENRHSGNLSLLWSLHYYLRLNTWLWVKGTGLVAAVLFFWRFFCRRKTGFMGLSREEKFLWVWSASSIPYVILVRQGNFIHDYYLLPFIFPFCFLAGLQLHDLFTQQSQRMTRILLSLVLLAQVAIGAHALTSLKPIENDPVLGRPSFCQMENELPAGNELPKK